jgi:hypothetical protein
MILHLCSGTRYKFYFYAYNNVASKLPCGSDVCSIHKILTMPQVMVEVGKPANAL